VREKRKRRVTERKREKERVSVMKIKRYEKERRIVRVTERDTICEKGDIVGERKRKYDRERET
jgi:hypothetical protein